MLKPGPDHPITIKPATTRWRAFFAGHVIADSADAAVLQEASYPQVVYFPREDVGMEYMSRTERKTHCPYKGDASYYTLVMDGEIAENVAWSYEAPFEGMEAIDGRIAFYTDRVEVYPVDDAAVNPRHGERERAAEAGVADANVDEVVQHTDAGDGRSQREHWPPTAGTPDQPDGGLR
jgi:uncharacterized protein (DUF427 family)